ncbi:MAG TPA: hypothetical protein VHD36_02505 [Pirellulales bacterium]|nr:hypothetical protein [Pirellulales bacterium]
MIHRARPSALRFALLVPAGVALLAAGCIQADRHTAESEETRDLPTVGTQKVSIKTDNGFVRVRPADPGVDTIHIRAEIRATGHTPAEAQECLEAIEITTPVSGADDATQEISWAWREPRRSGWRADVSFTVTMPHQLDLDVKTDNGQIDVVGTTGACHVHTENGAVRVVAAEDELKAQSTNGSITVDSPAEEVRLRTTNGAISARLTNDRRVSGGIKTDNGGIKLSLAKDAGTVIQARTSNGRIRSSLSLSELERKGRTYLAGKHAGGGELLSIETHNGGITLAIAEPSRNDQDQDD